MPNPAFASPTAPFLARARPSKAVCHHCPAVQMTQNPMPIRVGHGFDLHRLEPGLPLILGGVSLKHDRGCAGHSDGDAVYHCVVDAILGALALPDIGQIFPDTDPRFKDCASHVFMTAAYQRMHDAGFVVGNVDVTVILERPKMSPHKVHMRENIAALLHVPLDRVNLKAKTHERVDAVGENRAVSVHAVATLYARESDDAPSVAEARVATAVDPADVGAKVTGALLGMMGNRVAAVQDATAAASASVEISRVSDCAVKRLYDTVVSRKGADASSSWTSQLFSKGRAKIAEKVGEEAVEVVIDAVRDRRDGVVKESADLLYHLNVLWADMDITPDDVFDELASRENKSGIVEKAARK